VGKTVIQCNNVIDQCCSKSLFGLHLLYRVTMAEGYEAVVVQLPAWHSYHLRVAKAARSEHCRKSSGFGICDSTSTSAASRDSTTMANKTFFCKKLIINQG